ncbi:MAG: hypothetical protein H6710_08720 [Myxococcales bacterium]|nr:hypothetical protein [Myxococcales bacterium]
MDRSSPPPLSGPPPPPERRMPPLGERPQPASLQALLTAPAPLSEPVGPITPAPGTQPPPSRASWEASGSLPSPGESIELDVEDVAASHPRGVTPSPSTPAPARAREASATSDFEAAFFGGGDAFFDDPASDSMADGDPFASTVAPAARPIPWGPILAGGALLLLVLAIGLRGGDDEKAGDTDGASAAESGDKDEASADKADKAEKSDKADKSDEEKAKGEGEGEGAGKPEEAAAPEAAPPPKAPPPADDPELKAKLAEARAAYEKHRLKPAEAALEEVAASHPNHPEVLLLRAQIQLERGDLAGSLATSTRCVEAAPTQADCWLTLGVLHQNNKSTEAAIKAYETYLELAPEGRYARDATSQLARLKK